MYRYADPRACPGCRSVMEYGVTRCGTCDLPLTGHLAQRLFATLSEADTLVGQLRATVAVPVVPVPAPAAPTPPTYPRSTDWPESPSRGGLSAASVPKILLGLGATCLMVAALVFLAVAWATLGVGGRTGVLVGFTGVAAVLTRWVARSDLRAGAEAFATVGLGLLALDFGGAKAAGWLGDIDDSWFLVIAGTGVAAAAAGAARWAASTRVSRLVCAEVVGAVAVLTAAVGAFATVERSHAAGLLVALLVCAAGAVAGRRLGLGVLSVSCAAETACFWLVLTGIGVLRLDEPTIAHVWGELAVWPTLVAAALAGAVAVPRTLPLPLRVAGASTGVLLATLAATVVVLDESATRIALAELAVVAAYAVLAARLPGAWRWVCATPSVIAALGLAVSLLLLVSAALVTLLVNEPWTRGPLSALDGADVVWTWPLLLPAGTVGVSVAASTLLRCAGGPPRVLLVPGAAATLAGLGLVPALYGVPLAAAVLALLTATAVLAVLAHRVGRVEPVAAGAVTAALALGAALANDWTTAGVLALFTTAALLAEVRGPDAARAAGAFLAPLTGAGLIWTVGHLAGLDTVWRALPVLLVLGVAIVARPVLEREATSAAASAVAVFGSVLSPDGLDHRWLAIYLTLAAAIATVSSQVHPDRRPLAWPGLALFALASLSATGHSWTLAGVLALFTAVAVLHELRGDEPCRSAGRALAPLSGAGLLWTVGELAGVEAPWRGLPVVVALGVAVVLLPAVERELTAAVAAAAAVLGSVVDAGTVDQTWLAVYLTLAGVAATGSSLVHPSRRRLAWVGLACFTLAQWIRLQQIGVGTVEAYTLPLALVLLVVGTVALLRGTRSSLQTLAPGLGLALVPTLLQVLVDPVSTRAVLLGIGCLLLVAVGLVRGWAAPLLAGAGTGALVVLREATFASVLPQWAMIGVVGVLLTVVGVTWEQRLAELRRASAYVRRLR